MNRGIYATVSGMIGNQQWLDVVANNLANVNTTGFKSDGMSFEASLQQNLYANGGTGGLVGNMALGSSPGNQYTSFELGPMQNTGNPLDIALSDPSQMISVQENGQNYYTRDGSLALDNQRNLVTNGGAQVLDTQGKPIQLPQGTISIGSDGSVAVDGKAISTIGVFTGQFTKVGGNMYSGTNTQGAATPAVQSGYLEGSNVNPVQAMVDLIKIGRLYDLQQKAVSQQDQLTSKLTTAIG